MTFEELKAEAQKQGYSLIPNNSIELLPCTCGHRRRDRLFNANTHIYTVRCKKCGKKVSGESLKKAMLNWNRHIEEESR